jgi:hypothetical protein
MLSLLACKVGSFASYPSASLASFLSVVAKRGAATNQTRAPAVTVFGAAGAWVCAAMDKYEKVKQIGEGAYGKALLVRSKTEGKQFVIKEVNISKVCVRNGIL